MQAISLITAQDLGFEPRGYSLYPDAGQFIGRVHFWGKLGAMETALFFGVGAEGEEFYAPLDSSSMPDECASLLVYLRMNDLCAITTHLNFRGIHCVNNIILLVQIAVCA